MHRKGGWTEGRERGRRRGGEGEKKRGPAKVESMRRFIIQSAILNQRPFLGWR